MNKPMFLTSIRLMSYSLLIFLMLSLLFCSASPTKVRKTELFTKGWLFHRGDVPNGQEPGLDDTSWRKLNLPHDWSIEGEFSPDHPATPGGGALPGGIGWYRKTFTLPLTEKNRLTFIDFDGVYQNSEVWINGNYLGKRPYGYSSFRYELTPYLKYGNEKNLIAVKVDNSLQPNSRWYTGSGIYRNVWLVMTNKIHVDHWGTFVTTPVVTEQMANISIRIKVRNASPQAQPIKLSTTIYNNEGKKITNSASENILSENSVREIQQILNIEQPGLWSIENPQLYKAVTTIEYDGKVGDDYETNFGIRTFAFDSAKGFFLNGKPIKIKGVCNHHDLGCLGAAVNRRAMARQLEILKEMGCNAIRTSHNPPAPELLDLCDEMGFIVMDEAFDIWKKNKSPHDYAFSWDEWHERDLEDLVKRDRNHPCVFIWSIGNEVLEQWNQKESSGTVIARELAAIVKSLDNTRPVTAACNDQNPLNPVIKSGVLDLIGYNYHQNSFTDFPKIYPGKCFIATETTSALATRGHYDMPSATIRRWPDRWDKPFDKGNPDNTCSAYDNCSTPWGSTHEETWKVIKNHEFLAGMFIWTGFDYLGEPTPYGWPSRSSYFGIIDLAGFPKDAFYLYQSEWTDKPVLHLFPHWNWNAGDSVDVWAYTNADEVELFLNGVPMGTRQKSDDMLHLQWTLIFSPGTLKAVAKSGGKEILIREVKTAGAPAKIFLSADREVLSADGRDLSFITVKVLDQNGILVPNADNPVNFEVNGAGFIAGVDNGCQTSLEAFKANYRKAFNVMCLVVLQSTEKAGEIILKATSDGLEESTIVIKTK